MGKRMTKMRMKDFGKNKEVARFMREEGD